MPKATFIVACSRRSDSVARERKRNFPSLPSFFSRSFARSPLSERLEQATFIELGIYHGSLTVFVLTSHAKILISVVI